MTDDKDDQAESLSPATSVGTGLDDDVRAAKERIERERAKERLENLQSFLGRSSRASRPIVRTLAICVAVALGIGGCFIITRPTQVREPGPECAVPSSFDGAQEANADAASINAILGEVKMPFFKLVWGAKADVMRQRAYACTATFAAMHGVNAASLVGDVEAQAKTWLDDPERAHPGAQVILTAIAAPNVTPQFPRRIAPLLKHFDRAVVTLGRSADANRLVLDIAAASENLAPDERDAIHAAVRRLYPEPEPLLDAARARKDHGAAALGWLRAEDMDRLVDWYVRAHLEEKEKGASGPLPTLSKMMGGTPATVFAVAKEAARVQPEAFTAIVDKEMKVIEYDAEGKPHVNVSEKRKSAAAAYSELDAIVAINFENATRRCGRLFIGQARVGHVPSVADEIRALYTKLDCDNMHWLREPR